MTAAVFIASPGELADAVSGGTVRIGGSEAHHAMRVMRLNVGEDVDVVDGAGRRVRGTVAAQSSDELIVDVIEVVDETRAGVIFTAVQALPKGEHAELAVDLLTQAGVDEIVPWQAARCVARWKPDRAERAQAKWAASAVQAAKQCRRSRIPVIAELIDTNALAHRVAAADVALVLHEEATDSLADLALPASGEILLIIGPEGGLAPEEVARLTEAGAHAVRLGPEVLRASFAGAAAVTALSARLRWPDSVMGGSGA